MGKDNIAKRVKDAAEGVAHGFLPEAAARLTGRVTRDGDTRPGESGSATAEGGATATPEDK